MYNVKRFLIRLLASLGIGYIFYLVAIGVGRTGAQEEAYIMLNVGISLLFVFWTYELMLLYFGLASKLEVSIFYAKRPQEIYRWMDSLDGLDSEIKEIVGKEQIKRNRLMRDLIYIKNQFKKYANRDITKLKLFRASIVAKREDSFNPVFLSTILSIVTGIGLHTWKQGIQLDFLPKFDTINSENLSIIMDWLNIAYSFVIIVVPLTYTIQTMLKGKNRYRLAKEILDICIEELEQEQKSAS